MTQVGKGAFSTVYQVESDTVAKKYNVGRMLIGKHHDGYGIVTDESCWESFVRESDIYSNLRLSDIGNMFCRYRSHDPSTATLYIELGQQVDGFQWNSMSSCIVIHLAQALASLHCIGVVHGDIKADNIVRVRDRYTFIDFGCSIQLANMPTVQQDANYFFNVDIRATKDMLSATITRWEKDCSLRILFDTVYSLYFDMHSKVTRLP